MTFEYFKRIIRREFPKEDFFMDFGLESDSCYYVCVVAKPIKEFEYDCFEAKSDCDVVFNENRENNQHWTIRTNNEHKKNASFNEAMKFAKEKLEAIANDRRIALGISTAVHG